MSSRFDLRVDGAVTISQIKKIYRHLRSRDFYELEEHTEEADAFPGNEIDFSVSGNTRECEPELLSDLDKMNVNYVMSIYADYDDYDSGGIGSLYFKRIYETKCNCVSINNDGTQIFTVGEIDNVLRALINVGLKRKDPLGILRNSDVSRFYPKCYNNISRWLVEFEKTLFSKVIYENMTTGMLSIIEDAAEVK